MILRKSLFFIFFVSAFVYGGCARTLQFGQGESKSGLQWYSLFSNVQTGMTKSQVEDRVGLSSIRNHDVEFQGQFYEEQWVYKNTFPATILYFKRGILEAKEYQD